MPAQRHAFFTKHGVDAIIFSERRKKDAGIFRLAWCD